MAQDANQHTRIDDLDALLRYLTEGLGYEQYAALWEMEPRIWDGQLRLTRQKHVDGKPYLPWDHPTIHGTPKPCNQEPVDPSIFCSNLTLKLDRHDRVQVISRELGFEWSTYRYRIAEGCDVRAIWPPRPLASQPAPDQQPEDSAGPAEVTDRSLSGQSPQKRLTSKEWLLGETGEVERRKKLKDIPKEITEFSGQIHSEMEKAVRAGIVDRVIKPRTIEAHLRTTTLFSKKKRSQKSPEKSTLEERTN